MEDIELRLKKSEEEKKRYFNQVLNRQSQIEGLQKSAYEAITILESIGPCLKTYAVEKAIRVLKGEHND